MERAPQVSAGEITAAIARLRRGAPSPRDGFGDRARSIGAAARRFLDRGDPIRRRALDELPAATGFSPAMIERSLDLVFSAIDERSLAAVAGAERGPVVPLLGIVSAGNIPGVALPQMTLALAAGSSCIVKTASGEPLLAVLFAEALAAVDAGLASRLAVLGWRGGRADCDGALAGGVDSLVAYGSDEAIAAWRDHAPRRFVGHGHRASFAVVRFEDEAVDRRALAAEAARDIALYDQLGCLSPQCLFTIGRSSRLRAEFVDHLAAELERLGSELPRGSVPEDRAIAIRRLQDEYEWREIRGDAVRLLQGAERSSWSIVEDETPEFRPSPLYRTIVVRHLETKAALPPALGEWLPRIESVGMGPWPDAEVAGVLAGIPRLVALGAMQSPDLHWRQGGIHPMSAILSGERA